MQNTRKAEIRNSSRSDTWGAFADALTRGKGYLNKYEMKDWVPLLGGVGVGDLVMGNAPELVQDVSYHGPSALIRGGNAATGGIGSYTIDRRTLDATMLGMDAIGLAGMAKYGVKKGIQAGLRRISKPSVDTPPSNKSRRDFMQDSAALGGAALLASAIPDVARQASKVSKHAAGKVAENHKYADLKSYLDDITEKANKEFADNSNRIYAEQKEFQRQFPDADYTGEYLYRDDIKRSMLENGDFIHKRNKEILQEIKSGKLDTDKSLDFALYDNAHPGSSFKLTSGDFELPEKELIKKYTNHLEKEVDMFSPKAKAEMRTLKQKYGEDWLNYLTDVPQSK